MGAATGNQKFKFTVTYQDKITAEITTKTLELKADGNDKLKIPYGATVTISEPSHPGYSLSFRQGDTLVESRADGSYQFTMTNDVTIMP